MSFVLIVRMRATEGNEDRAAAVAAELAAETRKEPGCELFIPGRDPDDPASLVIYEQYRDRAALETHRTTEHFQRLAVGGLFELVGPRERTFYETIA
jgi:quinol monooxygenase YgiN